MNARSHWLIFVIMAMFAGLSVWNFSPHWLAGNFMRVEWQSAEWTSNGLDVVTKRYVYRNALNARFFVEIDRLAPEPVAQICGGNGWANYDKTERQIKPMSITKYLNAPCPELNEAVEVAIRTVWCERFILEQCIGEVRADPLIVTRQP